MLKTFIITYTYEVVQSELSVELLNVLMIHEEKTSHIIITTKFVERLILVSSRIIVLRSYIKCSKECFIGHPNT